MKVLADVDVGKPSAFVGMSGIGKPVEINWNVEDDDDEEEKEDESWKNEVGGAEI